jgi:TIR domain
MDTVFVSYRRSDLGMLIGHLQSELVKQLGRVEVFVDQEGLADGAPYPSALRKAVIRSKLLVLLIGPRWLDVYDDQGRRRDGKDDWVAKEVGIALEHEIQVLPVLVDYADPWASGKALPDALAKVPSIQYTRLRSSPEKAFRADIKQLADVIRRLLREQRPRPHPALMLGAGALAGVALSFGGGWLAGRGPFAPPVVIEKTVTLPPKRVEVPVPTMDFRLLEPVADQRQARAIFLTSQETAIIPLSESNKSGNKELSLVTHPAELVMTIDQVFYENSDFGPDSDALKKLTGLLTKDEARDWSPTSKLKLGKGNSFVAEIKSRENISSPINTYILFKNNTHIKLSYRMHNITVTD